MGLSFGKLRFAKFKENVVKSGAIGSVNGIEPKTEDGEITLYATSIMMSPDEPKSSVANQIKNQASTSEKHTEEIATIRDSANSANTKADTNATAISALETTTATHTSDISALNSSVSYISDTLATKANDSDVVKTITLKGVELTKTDEGLVNIQADSKPTKDSQKLVYSGGVYEALSGKQDTLTIDTALDKYSTNPVTNSVITKAFEDKQDKYHTHEDSDAGTVTELTANMAVTSLVLGYGDATVQGEDVVSLAPTTFDENGINVDVYAGSGDLSTLIMTNLVIPAKSGTIALTSDIPKVDGTTVTISDNIISAADQTGTCVKYDSDKNVPISRDFVAGNKADNLYFQAGGGGEFHAWTYGGHLDFTGNGLKLNDVSIATVDDIPKITIDSSLSITSQNPVQNSVVTIAIDELSIGKLSGGATFIQHACLLGDIEYDTHDVASIPSYISFSAWQISATNEKENYKSLNYKLPHDAEDGSSYELVALDSSNNVVNTINEISCSTIDATNIGDNLKTAISTALIDKDIDASSTNAVQNQAVSLALSSVVKKVNNVEPTDGNVNVIELHSDQDLGFTSDTVLKFSTESGLSDAAFLYLKDEIGRIRRFYLKTNLTYGNFEDYNIAMQDWVESKITSATETKQDTLTAGEGISIDSDTNVISSSLQVTKNFISPYDASTSNITGGLYCSLTLSQIAGALPDTVELKTIQTRHRWSNLSNGNDNKSAYMRVQVLENGTWTTAYISTNSFNFRTENDVGELYPAFQLEPVDEAHRKISTTDTIRIGFVTAQSDTGWTMGYGTSTTSYGGTITNNAGLTYNHTMVFNLQWAETVTPQSYLEENLKQMIETHNTAEDAHANIVSSLEGKITTAQSKADETATSLSSLASQVNDNEAKINNNATDISGLQGTITNTIEPKIDELETNLSNLSSSSVKTVNNVTPTNGNVDVTADEIQMASGSATSVATRIEAIADSIKTLDGEGYDSPETLNDVITALKAVIEKLGGAVVQKATRVEWLKATEGQYAYVKIPINFEIKAGYTVCFDFLGGEINDEDINIQQISSSQSQMFYKVASIMDSDASEYYDQYEQTGISSYEWMRYTNQFKINWSKRLLATGSYDYRNSLDGITYTESDSYGTWYANKRYSIERTITKEISPTYLTLFETPTLSIFESPQSRDTYATTEYTSLQNKITLYEFAIKDAEGNYLVRLLPYKDKSGIGFMRDVINFKDYYPVDTSTSFVCGDEVT